MSATIRNSRKSIRSRVPKRSASRWSTGNVAGEGPLWTEDHAKPNWLDLYKQHTFGDAKLEAAAISSAIRHADRVVNQIVLDVRSGDAHLDDVRAVMAEFIRRVDHHHPIEYIVHFLRDSFESYLSGEHTLEQALGIRRANPGGPRVDERRQIGIAVAVLKVVLKGRHVEFAAGDVSKPFGIGKTQALEYWRRHKDQAIFVVEQERKDAGTTWTKTELATIATLRKRIARGISQMVARTISGKSKE